MQTLVFPVLLLIAAAVPDATNLERFGTDNQATLDNNLCNNSVLVCLSSNSVGFCVRKNDEWDMWNLGDCPTGCCYNGQCTTENCCSRVADLPFICTTTGMFPNPGDYTQYHFCVKDQNGEELIEHRETCDDGYGYNPKSTFCDKELSDEELFTCPVPSCKNLGENGAIKENQTLYYVCVHHPDKLPEKILYPIVSACPYGRTYNASVTSCE